MLNNPSRFAVVFFPSLAIINTVVVFKLGLDVRPFMIAWPLFFAILLFRGVDLARIFNIRLQDFFILLFLVFCGFSSAFSASSRSLVEYVQLLYLVSVYFVMRYVFEQEGAMVAIRYMLKFSVVMIFFAMISFVMKTPFPPTLEIGTAGVGFSEYSGVDLVRGFRVSIFGLGAVLTAAIFVVLFVFSFALKFRHPVAAWCLRGFIFGAVLLTDSRAAIVIVFLFIVLYGVYVYMGAFSLFFGALVVAGVGVYFYEEIMYRLLYRFGEMDYSTLYHLAVWDSAYWIFDSNKLLGVGLGEFVEHWMVPEFHSYYSLVFNDIDPHNIFLKLMAETGVLGTLSFGLFVASIIFLTNWKSRNSVLIVFGFGALLLMNMTMNAFFVEFFWVTAALCAAKSPDLINDNCSRVDSVTRKAIGA